MLRALEPRITMISETWKYETRVDTVVYVDDDGSVDIAVEPRVKKKLIATNSKTIGLYSWADLTVFDADQLWMTVAESALTRVKLKPVVRFAGGRTRRRVKHKFAQFKIREKQCEVVCIYNKI